MDLDAVRTMVAVADTGQFQLAAAELSLSQQAVSKRVAALEKDLGTRLFTRTARGVTLTDDGRAFLPHARDLIRAEQRAVASVRPGSRALRVDVIGRKLAPAGLLHGFHREHPALELDVVTLFDLEAAIAALRSGVIDASFRAIPPPARDVPAGALAAGTLPDTIVAAPVLDEPLHLLTGPRHDLAGATEIAPMSLAGHRIWMPGIVAGTEWAAYYGALATAFAFTIDAAGREFGAEPLLEVIAGHDAVATFVGAGTRLVWPADWDLRRVPLHGPTPIYPHSLIWRADNPHPGLAALRDHLARAASWHADAWMPTWAQRPPGWRPPS